MVVKDKVLCFTVDKAEGPSLYSWLFARYIALKIDKRKNLLEFRSVGLLYRNVKNI